MRVSYNKLWKLLIDRGLNKTDLRIGAKITSNAIAKMGKNESVKVETLVKICAFLECSMDDIVEVMKESE